MYERLKGDASGGGGRTQSAQAARRACLRTEPGPDRQQPPDATMTWLIEELEQHSRETRGVEYGGAEREHTDLPTMVTRNGDTGRWPRWAERASEPYQTYYAGGRETVTVALPDGRTEKEERPCMSLDACSLWDANIPREGRVSED